MGWVFGVDDPPEPPKEITAEAINAVKLDPDDGRSQMVAAFAYFFTKELD